MQSFWEEIPNAEESEKGTTFRMGVPDGWIVRHLHIIYSNTGFAETMCFVKDVDHKWIIDRRRTKCEENS